MRESTVENYLVKQVKKHGGDAEKFTGKTGRPDRVVSWDYPFVDFVECKAPGKSPRLSQWRDHKRRASRGHRVWVIDTKAKVDKYIAFCLARKVGRAAVSYRGIELVWDRQLAA